MRVHVAVTEGTRLRPGPRARDHPARARTSPTRQPPASAQPAAAGMVLLLPARRLGRDLRIPAPVHLAAGHLLASRQVPSGHVEGAPATPPSGVVANGRRGRAVRPGARGDCSLPLRGQPSPSPLGVGDARSCPMITGMVSWKRMRWKSARPSSGGPGETDGPKAPAPRPGPDPTSAASCAAACRAEAIERADYAPVEPTLLHELDLAFFEDRYAVAGLRWRAGAGRHGAPSGERHGTRDPTPRRPGDCRTHRFEGCSGRLLERGPRLPSVTRAIRTSPRPCSVPTSGGRANLTPSIAGR